ncbi:2-amino-4-hydroxy-6-hydroxymethyldihydropteridine diphosphokinase [Terrilactibacillus laevilacticus]|uniref:2-amino-4-hydroxy-6-hydroxymethyldihydropteridine diphosphokinase n=1 Tax=Terrilactibacillus laevilacticus TaxID=1380157 RepID=A0ABW5PRI2_9BACI|nr:2-amino-4-hydroxy-6-hydroxymethyldihydropteridine diphosphokinase [Terrilactibacillus laevilacticus]
MTQSIAYIGLGSNMGNRIDYLQKACVSMNQLSNVKIVNCSSIYETAPYGPVKQADFLNMVAKIETSLSAIDLLHQLQQIELSLNRKREIHWGPRTIDLDILLYNQENIEMEDLIVPHPEISKRLFVLVPLLDLDPNLTITKIDRTVSELYKERKEDEGVRLWKRNNGEGEFGLFEN